MAKKGMGIAMNETDPVEEIKAEEAKAAPAALDESARPRQGNQPLCSIHQVQMVSYSTGSIFTYYKCPEKGCRETDKRIRPVGPCKNLYGNGKSAKTSE